MRSLILLSLLLAGGCGSPDFWAFRTQNLTGGATEFVAVWVGDSPLDAVDEVWFTIERVELMGPEGPVTVSDERRTLDLLTLQNGVRELLGEVEVPAGTYERVRVTLAAPSAAAFRVRTEGTDRPLLLRGSRVVEIPLRQELEGDGRTEIHLDVNVRTSVVRGGDVWYLDPAMAAVRTDRAGFASGRVVDGADGPPIGGATVSAQRAGVEAASTRTRYDGTYELGPLPPGVYDVVVTAPGRSPHVENGVRIGTGRATLGDTTLRSSPAAALTGTTPPAATRVQVMQGGALVAIAGIDVETGTFVVEDLAPGDYEVVSWDAQGELGTRRSVVVGALEHAYVDLR